MPDCIAMGELFSWLIPVSAVGFFIWLLVGRSPSKPPDPDNPRDLGTLTGMLGGSFHDAAVARYVLERAKKNRERSGSE